MPKVSWLLMTEKNKGTYDSSANFATPKRVIP
jgi:hypothetical protein